MPTLGPRGLCDPSHVWSLGNLQVAVSAVMIIVVMPIVLMVVSSFMAVAALMEEEREHTQETELGVHVDSHCPLNSRHLQ